MYLCCKHSAFHGDGLGDLKWCSKQAITEQESPWLTHIPTAESQPLLCSTTPSKIRGRQFTLCNNYTRPESSEAQHCQSVVFKCYESAPFPSPKSGGWLKKSHSLKNIKSVGIFFFLFTFWSLFWAGLNACLSLPPPLFPALRQNERRDSHVLTRFRASQKTLHNTSHRSRPWEGTPWGRRVTFHGPWTDTVQDRKQKNSVQIWNFLFFASSMLCWGIFISEYLAAIAGTISIYIKVLWRMGEFIPSPQQQEYTVSSGCHLWNLIQILEPPQVPFKFSAAVPLPSLRGMPPHSQNTLTQVEPRSPKAKRQSSWPHWAALWHHRATSRDQICSTSMQPPPCRSSQTSTASSSLQPSQGQMARWDFFGLRPQLGLQLNEVRPKRYILEGLVRIYMCKGDEHPKEHLWSMWLPFGVLPLGLLFLKRFIRFLVAWQWKSLPWLLCNMSLHGRAQSKPVLPRAAGIWSLDLLPGQSWCPRGCTPAWGPTLLPASNYRITASFPSPRSHPGSWSVCPEMLL